MPLKKAQGQAEPKIKPSQEPGGETRPQNQSICGCSACGHINPPEARFCEECGAPVGSLPCPRCGSAIPPGGDLCEKCGTRLHGEQCAFCGAPLDHGGAFCGECGNPSAGICCPKCGTASFFDYCPKCHTRLSGQADALIESLRKDPAVKNWLDNKAEYDRLRVEIETVEQSLDGGSAVASNETGSPDTDSSPASAEQEEEDQTDALFLDMMARKIKSKTANRETGEIPVSEKKRSDGNISSSRSGDRTRKQKDKPIRQSDSREKLEARKRLEALKHKKEELEQKLRERPDLSRFKKAADNQEARRMEMSIKPPVIKGWICNAFHKLHGDPMECTRPGDGGRWVTEE